MSADTDAGTGRLTKAWVQSRNAALTQFPKKLYAECSINEEEKHKQQAQISNLKKNKRSIT